MTSCRIRLKFSKLDGVVYLGHLELADALRRTVRRAGVNVAYTQGYRPRPKIDLGRALPMGIESSCEYIDVTFEGSCDTNDLCTVLNAASPEGIKFTEAIVVEESTASIEESIVAANYEVDLGDHAAADDAISVFNARETAAAHVIRKGKTREIDVKSCVSNLAIREGDVLSLTLSHRAPTLKIGEVLAAIMGFSNEVVSELHVMKVGVHFNEAGSRK
ncbi:MAG: TIGR03936 family radical SAM-associated protein [candidate division Zixibacteria bacterium]|nr:TIGR03936 family radical SAM-associated protein [candidate division Zixibacteria bacterium]